VWLARVAVWCSEWWVSYGERDD